MNHSKDTLQEKEEENIYQSPIKSMFDKFANHKDVALIYGDPITHEKNTIVPVAKMKYSFGAGGGTNFKEGKRKSRGKGEGGGGHITVRPIGVYEMTADCVRFKPAIDLKFILTLGSFFTIGLTFLLRKKK